MATKTTKTASLIQRIDAWSRAISKLSTDDVHNLAIEALEHMERHGDIGPIHRLQSVMPRSLRKIEFAKWAATYAPILWQKRTKEDTFGACKVNKDVKAPAFNIKGARDNPFWVTNEATAKPYGAELLKLLDQFVKKAEKALEEERELADGITAQLIEAELKLARMARDNAANALKKQGFIDPMKPAKGATPTVN